jgi:hypothetical protein
LFLGKGCDNTDINTAVIEYVANTRGFYQRLLFKTNGYCVKDRSGKEKVTPVKISDADWKTLIKIFDDITLEELKDLKSPTEKRFMTVQRSPI